MTEIVRVVHQLSDDERELKTVCERAIQDGLNSFISMGKALAVVRERNLYREEYATFEDYCQGRWRFNLTRASQLISAASTATRLQEITQVAVNNERVARELRRFPEDLQPAILQVASGMAADHDVDLTSSLVKAAGNVLQEAARTGTVDLGTGDSHPITVAVAAEETERILRRWEHVRAGSPWDRVLEDTARLKWDENGEIWMRVSGIREGQRVRVLAWRESDAD